MFSALHHQLLKAFDFLSRPARLAAAGLILLAGGSAALGVIISSPTAAAPDPGKSGPPGTVTPASEDNDYHPGRRSSSGWLLPDLQTLQPRYLRVEHLSWKTGGPYLRFNNSIINTGRGPLELQGNIHQNTEGISVSQKVYHQGDREPAVFEVGEYVHHPYHDHWHLDNFILYEIYRANPEGELLELVQTNHKSGYCLADSDPAPADSSPLGKPAEQPVYVSCLNDRQGLSVGWVDVYHFWYAGQSLDVGGLPAGIYALRSEADPDNLVRELNEKNNTAVIYFLLEGGDLKLSGSRKELHQAETPFEEPSPSPSQN